MLSCPNCLGELRPDPAAAAEAMASLLAAGQHLFRPDGLPPFSSGPGCTLLRLAAHGPLVFTGADALVEASVVGADVGAVPPLTCQDFDGTALFRLTRYEAAARALVAMGTDDAALGTFIHTGGRIDVRDETSAPVGRLQRAPAGVDWEMVETGGACLATFEVVDQDQDGWVDDQWSLRQEATHLPLQPLAAVALVLAAKVMLGRPWPVSTGQTGDDPIVDLDDLRGLL